MVAEMTPTRVGTLKIDSSLGPGNTDTSARARSLEAAGYDGVWTGETSHDPFLRLLSAANATERVTLGAGVVIAFARTPMVVANSSWDLQEYSGGRFVLGLGSQVRAHIEKRFSMPWSHPAPRMREFVLALRAIWDSWQSGTRLNFRGDFYTHTLMTPFFSPEPNSYPTPPVLLAGVGEAMTEVAGEVCDGLVFHTFTTERYFREVTLPALARGRAKVGKTLQGFEVCGPPFVVTGDTEEELAARAKPVKQQIAFYASTPAYRPVLELHGWGDLQGELNTLSKEGRWLEMGDLIDDTMLRAFASVGQPEAVGRELRERFGDIATRIILPTPSQADGDPIIRVLQAARSTS
jgi:probable F420-dependent oxidoreductase